MPERIQRKRTRGWRQPDSAISVTRPSHWGNIFYIVGFNVYGPAVLPRYRFDMPYHTQSRCVGDVMYRAGLNASGLLPQQSTSP